MSQGTTTGRSAPARPGVPGRQATGFRLDIQGLRAIAVLTVLIYHAGFPLADGGFIGVDIFFVISGFLITGGIHRELQRTGRFSIVRFYSRRAARILPAACVALLATIVLSFAFLPMTRWEQIAKDAIASALYVVNWLFAQSSLDYMARDAEASPLQHFWSLAVEEQYYIVWPVVMVIVSTLALRRWGSRMPGYAIALTLVAVPSFIWSVALSHENPGPAYFVTTTRAWELSIGAALAIFGPVLAARLGRLAGPLALSGLGAITLSVLTFDKTTVFPGYAAALPVLGAAVVILAGLASQQTAGARLLSLPPMVFIGDLSYSLYLWHWPLLIVAEALWGQPGWRLGLLIVALSVVPAWLSRRFVEEPFLRHAKKQTRERRIFVPTLAASLACIVAAGLLYLQVPRTEAPLGDPERAANTEYWGVAGQDIERGAASLLTGAATVPADSFPEIVPGVLEADQDTFGQECMQGTRVPELLECVYGDPDGAETIVYVGDSHAGMLLAGFDKAAADLGVRLVTYMKSSCPWAAGAVDYNGQANDSCQAWGAAVQGKINASDVAGVVSVSSRYELSGTGEGVEAGAEAVGGAQAAIWEPVLERGVPVLAVRNLPRPGTNVPSCVAAHEESLTECVWSRNSVLLPKSSEMYAVEQLEGARLLDLGDAVCIGGECPAVIDGVMVYRDNNHLTASYARTMHRHIEEGLAALLE
ncbi:acyltransferase family protein [Zafaria sp. J156]|uniref:acyltransferase family protein n=1 Tax=Zafaria sp. J156 TaxID=3116490 RepID=UPI002E76CC13|nr:acyltransferase family protein [Zafaria sp. J156]MEE1620663.1 acyltransferase family protein [Zafaria sp. J156]